MPPAPANTAPATAAPPTTAYVALGANLGDRAANLHGALARLAETPGVRVGRVSSFLENPAVGGPGGSPPFLNAVAEVQTSLDPAALLGRLLDVERAMGRVRDAKWGPRLIDLDLVLFGDAVVDSPDLKVPHPLMHERDFVLVPLAEIAPHVRHPTLGRTIGELAAARHSATLTRGFSAPSPGTPGEGWGGGQEGARPKEEGERMNEDEEATTSSPSSFILPTSSFSPDPLPSPPPAYRGREQDAAAVAGDGVGVGQRPSVESPDPLVLRPATNADGSAVRDLVFSVLREYGLAPDPCGTDLDLFDLEGRYAAAGGRFDVLVNPAGVVRGSAGLMPLDAETCELRKMYLHRSVRGQGWGRRLLDAMLAEARRRQFKRVTLETASVLKEAVGLYERYGFVPCAVDPVHKTPRCDAAYELFIR